MHINDSVGRNGQRFHINCENMQMHRYENNKNVSFESASIKIQAE